MFYWNNALPFDLWWRKEYKVSWGSKEHLATSFFIQFWEWVEAQSIKEVIKKKGDDEIDELSDVKIIKMTDDEIDEEFDNLDISKLE